jgi:hypothetical protein
MSLTTEQIKQQLAAFAARYGPSVIIPATVTAINNDDTVSVEFSDGSTIDDVRLKSVVSDGGKFVLVPKIDSVILVARIENSTEYVVISVHEVTEIKHVIGVVEGSVNGDGFLIKKGNDTLKQALIEFVEAMEPIIILEGRNPNMIKLASAKSKLQNLLR